MTNYKVNFKHDEESYIYCANIAKAESLEDVEKHYNKYCWYTIAEATEGDIREAERKGMPIITINHEEEPKEGETMTNTEKNYLDQVKEDIRNYLEYDYDIKAEIQAGEFADAEELREYLYDTMWIEDAITGNASGSYTFNRAEAREYVLADMGTVGEALREFGTTAEEIGERFLAEDWEYLDVTARCYVLGWALDEVLEEIEDEIEAEFERLEEAEA